MAAANSHSHALAVSHEPVERTSLFKEDRPRQIDRFISFFGTAGDDPCGEELLDALRADEESEQ
jgi:hypothetical protein